MFSRCLHKKTWHILRLRRKSVFGKYVVEKDKIYIYNKSTLIRKYANNLNTSKIFTSVEFDRVLILLIKQARLSRQSLDPALKSLLKSRHTHTDTNRYSNTCMCTLSVCGQDQGQIEANRLKCYRWDALHHDAASASASALCVQVPFWIDRSIERSIVIKKGFVVWKAHGLVVLIETELKRRGCATSRWAAKEFRLRAKIDGLFSCSVIKIHELDILPG